MTPVQVTKNKDVQMSFHVVETKFFLTHRLETSASRQENQDRRGKELVRQVRHVLLMRCHLVGKLDQPRRIHRTHCIRMRRTEYSIGE
jgi:hypothetical protein